MSCHSGPAPELTVAQVLQVFLREYLDRQPLPAHHLKVLRRLARPPCPRPKSQRRGQWPSLRRRYLYPWES